jgi:hypothetical protein
MDNDVLGEKGNVRCSREDSDNPTYHKTSGPKQSITDCSPNIQGFTLETYLVHVKRPSFFSQPTNPNDPPIDDKMQKKQISNVNGSLFWFTMFPMAVPWSVPHVRSLHRDWPLGM